MKKYFIKYLFLVIYLLSFKVVFAQTYSEFSIVAKVNNEVITKYDLNNRYKLILLSIKGKRSKNDNKQIYQQALEQLIEEQIKRQDALNKKIVLEPNMVANYIVDIEKREGLTSGSLKQKLRNKKIDYNKYYQKIEIDLLWSKIIATQIQPNIFVSEYEINEAVEYIVENPDRIRFNISEIFIPISKREGKEDVKAIAKRLVDEIEKSDNFEEVVDKFSRSSTVKNKGMIGWVDESDISPDIFDQIRDLNKGEISKPLFVENDGFGGYYIFKLNDKKQERIVKEEETERVRKILYNQKLNIAVKKYLDSLHKKTFVENY